MINKGKWKGNGFLFAAWLKRLDTMKIGQWEPEVKFGTDSKSLSSMDVKTIPIFFTKNALHCDRVRVNENHYNFPGKKKYLIIHYFNFSNFVFTHYCCKGFQ